MLAPEILANSIDHFFSRKLSLWLYNGSLTMYPMRLNRIQPRTLNQQSHGKYSHPSFSLPSLVVIFDKASQNATSDYPADEFILFFPP